MCLAIEKMKNDAIAEGREKGRAEGRMEGRVEGILDTLAGLVKDGILTLKQAADRAHLTVSEFEEKTGLRAQA